MISIEKPASAMVSNPPELGIKANFFAQFYVDSGRSFPWRHENISPFNILVGEILLKQTRAEKVAKVWPSLVSRYRNPSELAVADPDELFGTIAELGFGNQRTIALTELASAIIQVGKVPDRPSDLMKLPYVGIYTAHAVACFAFGQRVPVVDLSIIRVISRLAGIDPPADIRRAPLIWDIAWGLLPQYTVKEHNYGLLDFAALVCKPQSPRCSECSIMEKCAYAKRRKDSKEPIAVR